MAKETSPDKSKDKSKKTSKNKCKNFAAGIAKGAGTAGAVSGVALKSAGFYTLPHAVTGSTMLASTLGGASGAGTVGIIGGTAGVIGTTAAVLMSPLFIGAAGTLAVAGGCYGAYQYITKSTEEAEGKEAGAKGEEKP